jgi:hypothetical protein
MTPQFRLDKFIPSILRNHCMQIFFTSLPVRAIVNSIPEENDKRKSFSQPLGASKWVK